MIISALILGVGLHTIPIADPPIRIVPAPSYIPGYNYLPPTGQDVWNNTPPYYRVCNWVYVYGNNENISNRYNCGRQY